MILGTRWFVNDLLAVKGVGPVPHIAVGLNLESDEELDQSIWGVP